MSKIFYVKMKIDSGEEIGSELGEESKGWIKKGFMDKD